MVFAPEKENLKNMSSAGLLDEFQNLCFRTGKEYQNGEFIDENLDLINAMKNEILKRFVR